MTRTIKITDLPAERRLAARATADEHRRAQKVNAAAKTVFRLFAEGASVPVDALTDAIVEGMHADVTRSDTSSTRRRQADPLLALWRTVQAMQIADNFTGSAESNAVGDALVAHAERQQSIADHIATMERRFAYSLLTAEQRQRFDDYALGLRDGAAE